MTMRIEAGGGSLRYWRDIWTYRELLAFLAWRDLTVRYKQTALGVAWAVIRPAFTMLVFIAFRKLAALPPSGVPDAILVLSAVLPWQLVSTALTEVSGCLVGNANLISKVYFPRLLVPLASMATSVVDFLVTLAMLALVMIWLGYAPSMKVVLVPIFLVQAAGLALGAGVFFAALNVQFRDFRYVVPFVVQAGLFVSPVAFTLADVPEPWRWLVALNPVTGIIEGFRWCLLGANAPFYPLATLISVAMTLALLALGVWYFRRTERGFADVI
jgi:lipopolysaccharide transport system permease protein